MYKSTAQQGLFHSNNSPVDQATVNEFDQVTKGHYGSLPDHVKKKRVKEVFKARLKDALSKKGEATQPSDAIAPPKSPPLHAPPPAPKK
jgi:hypothetical protein